MMFFFAISTIDFFWDSFGRGHLLVSRLCGGSLFDFFQFSGVSGGDKEDDFYYLL